jgi:segregation and condensation protein B
LRQESANSSKNVPSLGVYPGVDREVAPGSFYDAQLEKCQQSADAAHLKIRQRCKTSGSEHQIRIAAGRGRGLFCEAMHKERLHRPSKPVQAAAERRESPLSLTRLREAFAAMLGEPGPVNSKTEEPDRPEASTQANAPVCEVSPRSVVEAILFVGRPDNGPITARELAAAMRGVSPKEVETAVSELNAMYDTDHSPYRIEQSTGGYRLLLRPEFERMRDKFYGRVKEARLSSTALEVLSVLAYNQPATAEQLSELRGSPCGAAIATLVRRKLVRLDRPPEAGESPKYSTTERFLQLIGLESLAALPRSEELR